MINIKIRNVWFFSIIRLLIYTKLFQIHEEFYQLVKMERKHKELCCYIRSKVICTFMNIWHHHGMLYGSIKSLSK